jgi:hypothetical protein
LISSIIFFEESYWISSSASFICSKTECRD